MPDDSTVLKRYTELKAGFDGIHLWYLGRHPQGYPLTAFETLAHLPPGDAFFAKLLPILWAGSQRPRPPRLEAMGFFFMDALCQSVPQELSQVLVELGYNDADMTWLHDFPGIHAVLGRQRNQQHQGWYAAAVRDELPYHAQLATGATFRKVVETICQDALALLADGWERRNYHDEFKHWPALRDAPCFLSLSDFLLPLATLRAQAQKAADYSAASSIAALDDRARQAVFRTLRSGDKTLLIETGSALMSEATEMLTVHGSGRLFPIPS